MTGYSRQLNKPPFNGNWSPEEMERRKLTELGHARIRAHDAWADEIEQRMRAGVLVNRRQLPAFAGKFSRPEPFIPLLARDRLYDWYSAVHEASHAVAALSFGCQITRILVSRGRCYVGHGAARTPHEEAVITYAGPVGEGLLTNSEEFLNASRSDYRAIFKMNLSAEERAAARVDAEKLVAKHHKRIEKFSDWLAMWGVMDGIEAEKLFRGY